MVYSAQDEKRVTGNLNKLNRFVGNEFGATFGANAREEREMEVRKVFSEVFGATCYFVSYAVLGYVLGAVVCLLAVGLAKLAGQTVPSDWQYLVGRIAVLSPTWYVLSRVGKRWHAKYEPTVPDCCRRGCCGTDECPGHCKR